MASPQVENGHLRIANEIWEQIMMSDFNREQRAILDLVLRLSWGCGRKVAHIPKQKHFTLAGVYESHVKKELRWLEKANVLKIDWENRLFQFNKDYDSWRVSIVRDYDEDELRELVALNLQISKNDSDDLQISKSDLQISKNGGAETGSTSDLEPGLKQVKTNDEEDEEDTRAREGDDPEWTHLFTQVFRGNVNEMVRDEINHACDEFGVELVKEAMRRALENAEGPPRQYLRGIFEGWRDEGIFTMQRLREADEKRNRRRSRKRAPPGRRSAVDEKLRELGVMGP